VQDPADARSASLEEAYNQLGRETSFEGVDEVTRGDIRRKLEVFCCDCPLHYDEDVARAHGYRMIVAPTAMTALWTLSAYWAPGQPPLFGPAVPEIRGDGTDRVNIPTPYSKGFASDNQAEYFEPLYPGDRLHGIGKLVDITPKTTRLGEGVFLTRETRVWKHTGELVQVRRSSSYRYEPAPERLREVEASRPVKEQPLAQEIEPTDAPVDWSQQISFESVNIGDELPAYSLWLSYQRLVMSVAADRMWSPIHHNREAARAQGLDDTILNSRGYEMMFEITLRRWMGLDGRLRKLGPYRIARSSHPGDMVTCSGRVTDKEVRDGVGLVHLELAVRNPRTEAARGNAIVSVPTRG